MKLVAMQVKDLSLQAAIAQLGVIDRRATLPILKVIKQALANALNNHHLPATDLELANIIVKDGVVYKRMRAVARGRGHSIEKRSCHVQVVLRTKQSSNDQPAITAANNNDTKIETKKT